MVVGQSAKTLIDLAVVALQQKQSVKVHCGPADTVNKCNVKISILPKLLSGGGFAQLWILSHLRARVHEAHVVGHTHDHTSGKTVITLNFWQHVSSGEANDDTADNDDSGDDDKFDDNNRRV